MTPVSAIRILPYILAGFCSIKCSYLSKMDRNPSDLIQYPATSRKEEESNIETTVLSDYDGQIDESQMTAMEVFLKSQLLINDLVFEDTSSNDSYGKKSNWKRDLPDGKWTHQDKMRYLQLHNILRGNVTPPAGNMAYLEWDTELEKLAQIWTDNCAFEHGQPDGARDYEKKHGDKIIGQNLYYGADRNGYLGLYLWYIEYHDYDLRNQRCLPNKQCGHYVQLAWSESTRIGCAITKCLHQRGYPRYLLACNYSPGALRGNQMYRVAEPCSRCFGNNVLCLKNLCITQEQCKNNPFDCQEAECNLKCHNCGRLDKGTCTCECTDGWDGRDCSQLCKNKNENCGKNPGYPSITVCPFLNHEVANTHCRKMCEKCRALNETSINTCCRKKLCEKGYVLDPSGKSCKCELLCPGSACDCPPFKIRKDMRVVYSKDNEGKTVATFSCHNNTKLIGSNSSECRRNGTWTISSPYCENCPSFEIRKNMNIVYSESNEGASVATFICLDDTKLIGSNTSECQPHGDWSDSQPYCEDCPPLEIRNDLDILYSENDKGASVATFTCHNDTILIGSNNSRCQPDGEWSFPLPYCEGEEVLLRLAAVRSNAESFRPFPSIAIWMIILKLMEIYLFKHSRYQFFSICSINL